MIEFRPICVDEVMHMYRVQIIMENQTSMLHDVMPKTMAESLAKQLTEESMSWMKDFRKLFYYTQGDYWSVSPHELDYMLLKYDNVTTPKKCAKCNLPTMVGEEIFNDEEKKYDENRVLCPVCKYGKEKTCFD